MYNADCVYVAFRGFQYFALHPPSFRWKELFTFAAVKCRAFLLPNEAGFHFRAKQDRPEALQESTELNYD